MKIFEIVYFNLRYFLPSLNLFIYKKVKHLARLKGNDVSLLDIGGRKSHYTINIPAEITVTDIPRESNIQVKLNLGVNENIINQLYSRRSNIKDYLIDHMVDTKLPKKSFDIVIAIEVLEHVEEDKTFINNVYDTLKPGGIYFMTTPNGDHVENTNPDHIRHYTKKQLFSILTSRFEIVDIEYAIYEDQ
jgi:SAM-dependent methyltransferase|tara:strand:+ start:13 stop:579 length:567 start_codon:yes stop_codon:yes gene_type:complete